jgi:hypothetical protein
MIEINLKFIPAFWRFGSIANVNLLPPLWSKKSTWWRDEPEASIINEKTIREQVTNAQRRQAE